MSDFAALFARTLLIGVAVAAPVGAMGVLCIQRTLAGGWRAGLATGAGIATADAAYAASAAFGIAALSSAIVEWQAPLRVVGGVALIWFGWRAFSAVPVRGTVADEASRKGLGGLYLSAVGLTLTNPLTIIAFAAVFASAGLVVSGGADAALVATVGVAAGSLMWWVALTGFVAALRHSVSDDALHAINRVSGVVVMLFGVVAVVAGVRSYL